MVLTLGNSMRRNDDAAKTKSDSQKAVSELETKVEQQNEIIEDQKKQIDELNSVENQPGDSIDAAEGA